MDTIRIISSCDDNYVHHLGTMLCSLFENKTNNYLVDVYIIEDGITNESKQKFTVLEKKYGFQIQYLKIDTEKYKKFMISGHINYSTYYRISIPEIISNDIDKILYLDGDLVIQKDILELWNIDITNHLCACVEDLGSTEEDRVRIGLLKNDKYFNAGVMLINLKKWREENTGPKVFDFIANNPDKVKYWDQDGLNSVLAKNTLFIDYKYNVMNYNHESLKFNQTLRYKKTIAPYIIHYTPGQKPTQLGCSHPFRAKYFSYINMTPWKYNRYALIKLNIINAIRLNIDSLRPFIIKTPLFKPLAYVWQKYFLKNSK